MSNDSAPELSVRTTDAGKEKWDRIGRLYKKPDFILPENYREKEVLRELILKGDLMPSVTNVIAVRNAPHLNYWYAKLVAEKAVEVVNDFPGLIERKPRNAINFLKEEPERVKNFWGDQGTRIHKYCELIALQQDTSHIVLTDYEQACIDEFKKWLDKFQPEFEHMEITGFGTTEKQLNYGGTADAIMKINNKRFITDYKCTTPDTEVLLPNGTSILAKDIEVGMEVVAWSKERNLHAARVTMVADNGAHPTVKITTATGHVLETTLNHPYLASRGKEMGFAFAEKLREGDNVYIASGWNYNLTKQETETDWPAEAPLGPYLYGLLWSVARNTAAPLTVDSVVSIPGIAREELREELRYNGFLFDQTDNLVLESGLNAIAAQRRTTPEAILETLNTPTLPDYLFTANKMSRTGFFLGVQELFIRRDLGMDEFLVSYLDTAAVTSLHQLFMNNCYDVTRVDTETVSYLRVPFKAPELNVYGPKATKIISIERNDTPTPTIAITVAGAHTHVTNGLITHNTNRSGLHIDIALQLSAGARFTEISPDAKTLTPMPKVDGALGIHISPKATLAQPIDIGEDNYETFSALRTAWGFHAFEGREKKAKGVLGKAVKSPEEL